MSTMALSGRCGWALVNLRLIRRLLAIVLIGALAAGAALAGHSAAVPASAARASPALVRGRPPCRSVPARRSERHSGALSRPTGSTASRPSIRPSGSASAFSERGVRVDLRSRGARPLVGRVRACGGGVSGCDGCSKGQRQPRRVRPRRAARVVQRTARSGWNRASTSPGHQPARAVRSCSRWR